MSTLTRYAFSVLICSYGIYELLTDHLIQGSVAVLLGAFVFWISRRR